MIVTVILLFLAVSFVCGLISMVLNAN